MAEYEAFPHATVGIQLGRQEPYFPGLRKISTCQLNCICYFFPLFFPGASKGDLFSFALLLLVVEIKKKCKRILKIILRLFSGSNTRTKILCPRYICPWYMHQNYLRHLLKCGFQGFVQVLLKRFCILDSRNRIFALLHRLHTKVRNKSKRYKRCSQRKFFFSPSNHLSPLLCKLLDGIDHVFII